MVDWFFPLPNFTSGNPLIDLSVHANNVTGNLFWSIILTAMVAISFMIFNRNNKLEKSLLGSLTIGSVLASFLSFAGLVGQEIIISMWLGTALTALLTYYSERRP